jgi:hypothetical protein
LGLIFSVIVAIQTFANNSPVFNQTISPASLSVDIVDSGGSSVSTPSVNFGNLTFSFGTQDAHGQFATSSEKVRAYNPTATDTWTVNLAGSAADALWTSGSDHYDFNDAGGYVDDGSLPTGTDDDSYGGQMTVDPSGGSITGVSGCSTDYLNKGTSESFVEGSNNSIDIFSAGSGAATTCSWDFVGSAANVTQEIPAGQPVGNYSITMTLSIQ